MTPDELAAIVARDATWQDTTKPMPSYGSCAADRRALLVLLRETREALAALDHAFGAMYVGGQWSATPDRIRVWIPAQKLLERLAALEPLP